MIIAILSIFLYSISVVMGCAECGCNYNWNLPHGESIPAKLAPDMFDCRQPITHNSASKRLPRHQEWIWGPMPRHHNSLPPLPPVPQNDIFAIYYEPADSFTAANFLPSQLSPISPFTSEELYRSQGSADNFNSAQFAHIYNPTITAAIFNHPDHQSHGSIGNVYQPGYLPNVHSYNEMRNSKPQSSEDTLLKSTSLRTFDNDLSENNARESFMDLTIVDGNENQMARSKYPNTEDSHKSFVNCVDLHLAMARMKSTSTESSLIQPYNRENTQGLYNIKDIQDKIDIQCKHAERTIDENVQAIMDSNPTKSFRTSDKALNIAEAIGLSNLHGEFSELSDDFDKDKMIENVPNKNYDTEESNVHENLTEFRGDVPATTESEIITTTMDDLTNITADIITTTEAIRDYTVSLVLNGDNVALREDSDELDSEETKHKLNEITVEEHNFVNLTKELEDLSDNISHDELRKILSGRIEFVHNKERIPLQFEQNKDGNIDIGIDGDYLCERLLEGPEKYIILKAICNSKPPLS